MNVETYIVEAETEVEAIEQLGNGCCDPVDTEFVDWIDGWEIEHVEELDPLYRMVKDFNPKYIMSEEEKHQLINAGPAFKG